MEAQKFALCMTTTDPSDHRQFYSNEVIVNKKCFQISFGIGNINQLEKLNNLAKSLTP